MTAKSIAILMGAIILGCSPATPRPVVAQTGGSGGGTVGIQETVGPTRYQASLPGGTLRLVDVSNNAVIIDERALQSISHTSLRPTMRMTAVPDGANITYTYVNNTDQPQLQGRINFGGIRFGDITEYWDIRHAAKKVRVDRRSEAKTFGAEYPSDLYSPVVVVEDANYILGISMMYAAVDYHQGVRVRFFNNQRWNGDGGPNYVASFEFLTPIGPGETREYSIAVRCQPKSEPWLKTLVPYRDYFQARYGRGPTYTRDARPVTALVMAEINNASEANPRAYSYPDRRPDVHGFRPWSREIVRRQAELGYNRVMVWAVSGLYDRARARNYPANAISPIMSEPIMRDSRMELANAASPTLSVGYYLGYSLQIERTWDEPGAFENLDPTNPDKLGVAMREYDMARELNATMIGLDAYNSEDPWIIYTYLAFLRNRYPEMKFLAEVSPPDITHTMAASFFFDMDVQSPNLLADFLIPGNESWLCVWGQQLTGQLGRQPTRTEWQTLMRQYAAMGYILLDLNTVPVDATMNAAAGWEVNIPVELRTTPDPRTPEVPIAPSWQVGPIIPGSARTPPLSNEESWGPSPNDGFAAPAAKLVRGSAGAGSASARGASAGAASVEGGGGGGGGASPGVALSGAGGGGAGGSSVSTITNTSATGVSSAVPIEGDPSARRSPTPMDRYSLERLQAAMVGVRSGKTPRAGTATRTGTLPVFLTGGQRVDPLLQPARQEVIVMPANTDATGPRR